MNKIAFHKTAFILSCLVGLIYGSHHFFIPHFLHGQNYYPVTSEANRDEGMFNGPRANAVYSGKFLTGDIDLAEHGSDPSLLPVLNPLILGFAGRLLGSLKAAFILSDFLFPPLIFLAIYFLAFELIESQVWAVLFGFVFIFTPKLGIFPSSDSLAFFTKFDQLYFSRIEYPKITFLFFALACYFLLRALKRENFYSAIAGGIFFGTMFYTYLYDWAYFIVGLGICALFFFFERDWKRLKIIFIILITGLFISFYYWLNFISLHALPQYHDIFLRVGTAISNQFALQVAWKSYLRIIFLVSALWLILRKKKKLNFNYSAGFLLPYFIVMNIQVFLGFNPQPDHWYKISFLPLDLALLILCFRIFEDYSGGKLKKYFNVTACTVIAVIALFGLRSQYNFSKENAGKYTVNNIYAESYQWFNTHTPAGSVVGSISFSTNDELQLFTRNNIFVPNGANSTASNAEIWDRFLISGKIFSVQPERFAGLVRDGNFYLFQDYYNNHTLSRYFYQENFVSNSAEKEYGIMLDEYKKLLSGDKAVNIKYKLDYIYFGPRERELGKDPSVLMRNLHKVYDKDGVIIYAL